MQIRITHKGAELFISSPIFKNSVEEDEVSFSPENSAYCSLEVRNKLIYGIKEQHIVIDLTDDDSGVTLTTIKLLASDVSIQGRFNLEDDWTDIKLIDAKSHRRIDKIITDNNEHSFFQELNERYPEVANKIGSLIPEDGQDVFEQWDVQKLVNNKKVEYRAVFSYDAETGDLTFCDFTCHCSYQVKKEDLSRPQMEYWTD